MGHKAMIGIVLSISCTCGAAVERLAEHDTIITTTTDIDQPASQATHHCTLHDNNDDDDRKVAEMAISTLASMAHSILNIGADAHNPAVVGTNVISILSNFVNFVTFALKNPGVIDLLEDEMFVDSLRCFIVKSMAHQQLDPADDEIL